MCCVCSRVVCALVCAHVYKRICVCSVCVHVYMCVYVCVKSSMHVVCMPKYVGMHGYEVVQLS